MQIASLNFLRSLMAWPALSNALNSKEMELIITEFPQLIKDADLTITQSVLKCASGTVILYLRILFRFLGKFSGWQRIEIGFVCKRIKIR